MTRLIPHHVQIETINGVCTSKCIMCNFKEWTRKPRVMSYDEFCGLMRKFEPHRDEIDYFTFHGDGEPLLDRNLPDKIAFAKDRGFKGLGLATNCTELDEVMARRLLDARLDTLICSVDGTRKETHEAIRVGTDFDEVVANVKRFLALRDAEYPDGTRVLVRFIRQQLNYDEWEPFHELWSGLVSPGKGDDVIRFDVHNCAGSVEDYESKACDDDPIGGYVCGYLFDRLIIFSDGRVALCPPDANGYFDHGNVFTDDPIAIFNDKHFTKYREYMEAGRGGELEHCRNCTLPRSNSKKTNPGAMQHSSAGAPAGAGE